MTSTTIQSGTFVISDVRPAFSFIERVVLRRSHPVSIFLDATAWIWVVYFLWAQSWQAALAAVVVARVLALVSLRNLNVEAMADTLMGKIGLLHLQPLNLTIQSIGALGLIWGLWTHATVTILIATSFILVGHVFGWAKVDARLA